MQVLDGRLLVAVVRLLEQRLTAQYPSSLCCWCRTGSGGTDGLIGISMDDSLIAPDPARQRERLERTLVEALALESDTAAVDTIVELDQ